MPACAPSRPLPFSTVTEKDLCVNEWAKCPSASARPTPWSHSPISPHGPAPCVPTRIHLCVRPPACPRSLSVCPLARPETGTTYIQENRIVVVGGPLVG